MFEGTLKRWNDGQGFGFIQTDAVGEDVFIHVSAFKGLVRRPVIGDTIIFKLETDDTGRKRAVNASIHGMESVFASRDIAKPKPELARKHSLPSQKSVRNRPHTSNNVSLRGIINFLVFLGLVFFGYQAYSQRASHVAPVAPKWTGFQSAEVIQAEPVVSQFKCEGKSRCPQMTSCAEATFYLNHCPGTITDGDGDGIPCEDQWCGH